MKKLTAILLSAVLMLTLAACSSEEENEAAKTDTDAVVETTAPVTEESTTSEKEPEDTFSGVTAVDNEYCKIEVTEIKEDSFGTNLTVELENKTEDTNLFFTAKTCCINGVAVNPLFGETVSAGKKAISSLSFLEDDLKKNGITKYTDIELTFRVYDPDNWDKDDIAVEAVHIYPYGESNAEVYVREEKETDIKVFDNDKVSATVIGYGEDEPADYRVYLYLENKSDDTDYTFAVSGCAVNGVEILSGGVFTVPAGKAALDSFYITDSILEENGITDFSDIYVSIRVYDPESWDADDVADNGVHLYPVGKDNAVPFVREAKATDKVIVDNESITVIVTGMTEDDIIDTQSLCFYFINKTNEKIMFSMEDVSINDYMIDPFFAVSVMPGFSKFSSASWFNDELNENGIESIEEISFTMLARNADDSDSEDILNEKVSYIP